MLHAGEEVQAIADATGYAPGYVRTLASAYGFADLRRVRVPSLSTYTIIGDLLRGMSRAEVAAKHRLSRQRIHQIVAKSIAGGIPIPGEQ